MDDFLKVVHRFLRQWIVRRRSAARVAGGKQVPVVSCAKCKAERVPLQACSRCKQVHYCGRNCQSLDWKTHKELCIISSGSTATPDPLSVRTFGNSAAMSNGSVPPSPLSNVPVIQSLLPLGLPPGLPPPGFPLGLPAGLPPGLPPPGFPSGTQERNGREVRKQELADRSTQTDPLFTAEQAGSVMRRSPIRYEVSALLGFREKLGSAPCPSFLTRVPAEFSATDPSVAPAPGRTDRWGLSPKPIDVTPQAPHSQLSKEGPASPGVPSEDEEKTAWKRAWKESYLDRLEPLAETAWKNHKAKLGRS